MTFKASVIMTVYNREPEVLLATLRSLYRAGAGAGDIEIVLIDDRSNFDYSWLNDYFAQRFSGVIKKLGDYPACRLPNGANGPCRAFNEALALAQSDRIIIMSSDVYVTPRALGKALDADVSDAMWTPRVIDIDSGAEYCGPTRFFPVPWFLVCRRAKLIEAGGWDEKYLEGNCFDDNDVAGRLALVCGEIEADWAAVVYHQSHPQPAYDTSIPEVKEAWERNRNWTKFKWGGIPFDHEFTPFDVLRKLDKQGRTRWTLKAAAGKLTRVLSMTEGMFKPEIDVESVTDASAI
jgi:hypothetical protein